MKNYIELKPRFSDYNGQGLLKSSIQLDLACESQLAQMEPRYDLPLSYFMSKGLRWHIANFNIDYHKVIRSYESIRIEADVVELTETAMIVRFSFNTINNEIKYTSGKIFFELADNEDKSVKISDEVYKKFEKNGLVN